MEKISVSSAHHVSAPFVRGRGASLGSVFSSLLPTILLVLLHAVHMLVLPALASSMSMMSEHSMEMNGMTMNEMSVMDHSMMHHMSQNANASGIPWMEIVWGAIWVVSIASIAQAVYQWWKLLRSRSMSKMNYVCAGFSTISFAVAVYSIAMLIG